MSRALDGKFRIHARLSNTSYMRLHSWTSASLRRLYIGQFLTLHFKDRQEDFLSKESKDILHYNKIFSCTMELPNDSACLVVIFVLFCFVLIWDESVTFFNQKYRKSFYSYKKITCSVTTLSEAFNRLQAFLFFSFLENQRGSQKKTYFALFGSRSVKILTPEPRWLRFLDRVWKRNLANDTIIYSGFLKNLERPSTSSRNLKIFKLRIYKVVCSIISNWLSVRVQF